MKLLVNLDVDDLAKGVRFYRPLGLKVGRRFGRAAVEMRGAAAPLYLLSKKRGTRAATTSDGL